MQIWKKNFMVTFILFVLIINAGTFFLVAAVHRNEFQREADSAVMEALNIGATAAALSGFEAGSGRIAQMGIKYREKWYIHTDQRTGFGGGTGSHQYDTVPDGIYG